MQNKLVTKIQSIRSNKIYLLILINGMFLNMPFITFGILIPIMSEELSLSASFMGIVLSMNSLSCFIAVFIAGNLIELFGIKKIIISSNIFLLIGAITITLSKNEFLFASSYFITGFGFGGLAIALTSLTSSIYVKQRSKKLLFLGIFMFIGSILGALSTRIVLSLGMTWRICFIIVGVLFFIILIVTAKTDLSKFNVKVSYDIRTFLKIYKNIILDKRLIVMGLIAFFHSGAVVIFSNWFTTYFKGFGVPVTTSALFLMLYSLSEIGGLFIKTKMLNFWSDSKVIIIKSVLALVCFIGLIFSSSILAKVVFIAGIGISSTGIFMLVSSLGVGLNKKSSGMVLGYIYSSAYIGSMILLYISGLIIDRFSSVSILYICLISWAIMTIFATVNIVLKKR